MGSGQSGALAGPLSVWGSLTYRQERHIVDGWFSSVEHFIVIHLDVVCV